MIFEICKKDEVQFQAGWDLMVASLPWDTSSVVCGSGSDQQVRVAGTVESLPLQAASGECRVLSQVGRSERHISAVPGKQKYKGRRKKQICSAIVSML